MKNKYYIGPAGWSYKDWEGIVYPKKKTKDFNKLNYISKYFNTIEINSSFYRPPTASTTLKWIDTIKDNPDFLFTYKLWQEFTHNRQSFPSQEKETLVKNGLDILHKNKKLGALLIQFPWSFKYNSESMEHIEKINSVFNQYLPVIEVRHGSWNNPDFFNYLKEKKLGFTNIDQPVIGDSLDITDLVINKTAYFRFHGRNYENWFKNNASPAARYDYLYNKNDLIEISSTLNILIENSQKTFIIFNNHYQGQAIANALQTMFLLEQQKLSIPDTLFGKYPQLTEFATLSKSNNQISLF